MNILKLTRRLIDRHYGLLGLPGIRSTQFLNLIRGTAQLIETTLKNQGSRRTMASLNINFSEDSSASTDFDLNIKIPAWYCYKEALTEFIGSPMSDKQAAAVALTIVNGSGIHEALHVALSHHVMTGSFKKSIESHSNPKLFMNLINIVEDLFIEDMFRRTGIPELLEFVDAKNEVFFSQALFDKALAQSESEHADDNKSIALGMLVFAKNINRRSAVSGLLSSFGLTEVDKLLKSVLTGEATGLRVPVAERLYEIFLKCDAVRDDDFSLVVSLEKAAAAVMMAVIKDRPEEKLEISMSGPGSVPSIKEVDITERFNVRPDNSYTYTSTSLKFGFMKELKTARMIVPSRSEPKTRGARLLNSRVANIVTDGKIFTSYGTSISEMQRKQPEFVILIDFSGSMNHLIGNVNETVRNMSKSMTTADIPHAVYGHTTYGYSDSPVLYHIYSYKTNGQTNSGQDARFDMVKRVTLSENLDGYAIQAAAKKFNKRSEKKVLIVLSDGCPSSPNYEGGTTHTKDSIKLVRQHGIKVIAMSLTAGVMKNNDDFYGKEFNVDATSQAKLQANMQRIIMQG